ncbi:hypothetical protein MPER_00396, partial [Moniliophthora perniciosa FA553]
MVTKHIEDHVRSQLKGIPYELAWVEYPDIENLCKTIGAPATDTKADGS